MRGSGTGRMCHTETASIFLQDPICEPVAYGTQGKDSSLWLSLELAFWLHMMSSRERVLQLEFLRCKRVMIGKITCKEIVWR